MHNLPFKNNSKRADQILRLVNTNLNGLHKTTRYDGSRYFLTFVDILSRSSVVYTIKSGDEVYKGFKDYIKKFKN